MNTTLPRPIPHPGSIRKLALACAAVAAGLLALPGQAADGQPPLDNMAGNGKHCDHAAHMKALPSAVTRSEAHYPLPEATLTGMDGKAVKLSDELAGNQPVLVNFIFTTCTTVCPVSSATFAKVQSDLDAAGLKYRLVSISIDPEQDTPARLRDYAGQYHAGGNWHFLTGDSTVIVDVLRSFKAYWGNKMNHVPVVLMRARPDSPWVRYEGFVKPADLVAEYRQLGSPKMMARH